MHGAVRALRAQWHLAVSDVAYSWRHAHNADAALIDDERARFYLEVFLEYWKTKTSDERWRSLELSRDGRGITSWCAG